MKRTWMFKHTEYSVMLFCAVALLNSCSDGVDQSESNVLNEKNSMAITAYQPDGSRACFDGDGNGLWQDCDTIAVRSKIDKKYVPFVIESGAGTARATFAGTIKGSVDAETSVLFPYNEKHTNATFYLPKSYTYTTVDNEYSVVNGNNFRMPMKGSITVSDNKNTVNFKNIGSVLAIKVDRLPSEDGTITVTASDNNIYGNAVIDDCIGIPDGGKKVTFYYSGAKTYSSGVFYLPMSPASYSIKIAVANEKGEEQYVTDSKTIDMKCGHIKSFEVTIGKSVVINGHKFVDLGLPSGILWAETNIGAETSVEKGTPFKWAITSANSTYSYSSIPTTWIKKSNLISNYDAASKNWGEACRIPTWDEANELRNNCVWTWESRSVNGNTIEGCKVTSKKNGNSIFLPSTGYYNNQEKLCVPECGFYWLSTIYDELNGENKYEEAYCMGFGGDDSFVLVWRTFDNSLYIRPVAEP